MIQVWVAFVYCRQRNPTVEESTKVAQTPKDSTAKRSSGGAPAWYGTCGNRAEIQVAFQGGQSGAVAAACVRVA